MLSVQKPKGSNTKCCPNVLPCRVHHNGPVNASSRYWRIQVESDGSRSSYFRGRRLRGNVAKIPDGYEGVVLMKTDRVVDANESTRDVGDGRLEEADEEEPDEQDNGTCVAMDQVASFDEFVTWAHETPPNRLDDPYAKGLDEWIKFAQAMHTYEQTDEKPRKSQK